MHITVVDRVAYGVGTDTVAAIVWFAVWHCCSCHLQLPTRISRHIKVCSITISNATDAHIHTHTHRILCCCCYFPWQKKMLLSHTHNGKHCLKNSARCEWSSATETPHQTTTTTIMWCWLSRHWQMQNNEANSHCIVYLRPFRRPVAANAPV